MERRETPKYRNTEDATLAAAQSKAFVPRATPTSHRRCGASQNIASAASLENEPQDLGRER